MHFAYCGFDENWQADLKVWQAAGRYLFDDLQLRQTTLVAEQIKSNDFLPVLNKCPFGSPLQVYCVLKAIQQDLSTGGADAEVAALYIELKRRWVVRMCLGMGRVGSRKIQIIIYLKGVM